MQNSMSFQVKKMSELYSHVDDVDLFVGGFLVSVSLNFFFFVWFRQWIS